MKRTRTKQLKIFMIAGEVSGDVLGAKIIREATAINPDIKFVGVGGQNMTEAGLKSLFPMSDLAVMGISEVVAHARTLSKRINQTIAAINSEKPDIVLTIDSPGFAKAVIKGVKKQGVLKRVKFYHVVAPQVWAWGAKRARKYAKIFDKLYAFFDFEKPYFEKYGLKTVAVGHPIADGLKRYKKNDDDKKVIAFVPGSRMNEVKKLLPVFHKTLNLLVESGYDKYKFVIPTVETTDKYIRENVKDWKYKPDIIPGNIRYDLYANTFIAIVASGTVSAELAIMHIPTIVVYKMNWLTSVLAHILVRVKWVSLINILLNKTVYPELLGKKANPALVAKYVQKLTNPLVRKDMINQLKNADTQWTHSGKNAARLIVQDIISEK